MKSDNPPAFPVNYSNEADGPTVMPSAGMTLRDYFAAHAPAMPPGLREMAKTAEKQDGRDTSDFGAFARYEADWRWSYADAMLKARPA